MEIARRRPMAHAVLSGVGGWKTIRAAAVTSTSPKPYFQRPRLAERSRRSVAGPLIHIATDYLFFGGELGIVTVVPGLDTTNLRACLRSLFQSRAREEALLATINNPEKYAPLRSRLGWSPPFPYTLLQLSTAKMYAGAHSQTRIRPRTCPMSRPEQVLPSYQSTKSRPPRR